MAGTFPRFRLYNNTGITLIYEFDKVTNWGDSPLLDPETFVIHESLRGQGGIVPEGSTTHWDLPLTFRLIKEDYENLIAEMQNVKNTIALNTKYILKIDLTTSTTLDLKVKRLESIRFPLVNRQKVVKHQTGIIIFKVNVWA